MNKSERLMEHLPSFAALGPLRVAAATGKFYGFAGKDIHDRAKQQAADLFMVWERASKLAHEAQRKRDKRERELYSNRQQMPNSLERYNAANELAMRTCARSNALLELLNHARRDLGVPLIERDDYPTIDDCVADERLRNRNRVANGR